MSFINYMTHYGRVYPTGIRGQCVEFARRWLIHHDILFENVEYAIDIWNIPSVIRLSDHQVLPFHSVPNKLPHGHVAVVIAVDHEKKQVYIDDRNRKDHLKTIPILTNGQVDDPDMIGWKVVV